MSAFIYKIKIEDCFKCKKEKGVYVMQDKKLTGGKWKSFCKDCYFEQFEPVRKK